MFRLKQAKPNFLPLHWSFGDKSSLLGMRYEKCAQLKRNLQPKRLISRLKPRFFTLIKTVRKLLTPPRAYFGRMGNARGAYNRFHSTEFRTTGPAES